MAIEMNRRVVRLFCVWMTLLISYDTRSLEAPPVKLRERFLLQISSGDAKRSMSQCDTERY